MNTKAVVASIIGALVLFVFVPTSKVSGTFDSVIKFETQAAYEQYKAGNKPVEQIVYKCADGWAPLEPGPCYKTRDLVHTNTGAKSGLRMAIEGRLKWLGLASELWIPLPCRDTEDGGVICARLL